MHSHYSLAFVYRQRPNRLGKLLYEAKEKTERNKAWEMWLMRYQNMTKDDFIDFESFYEKLTTPQQVANATETIQETFERFGKKIRRTTDGLGV